MDGIVPGQSEPGTLFTHCSFTRSNLFSFEWQCDRLERAQAVDPKLFVAGCSFLKFAEAFVRIGLLDFFNRLGNDDEVADDEHVEFRSEERFNRFLWRANDRLAADVEG